MTPDPVGQKEAVVLMVCDCCGKPTEIRDWRVTFPEDEERLCRCDEGDTGCGSETGRVFIPASAVREAVEPFLALKAQADAKRHLRGSTCEWRIAYDDLDRLASLLPDEEDK